MDKILQSIKSRLIYARQYLEFRLLWYRMSQDERREWLQEVRWLVRSREWNKRMTEAKALIPHD